MPSNVIGAKKYILLPSLYKNVELFLMRQTDRKQYNWVDSRRKYHIGNENHEEGMEIQSNQTIKEKMGQELEVAETKEKE